MPRFLGRSRLGWVLWTGLIVSSSGASCYPSLVCQLPPEPTLADVRAVVDGNASLVQSIFVRDAKISGRAQGWLIPGLKAHIALEKPRRFRLLAERPFAGEAADLGSNDEEFWYWLAQNEPAELFFIRHDDYARAAGRLPIPFDPYWVIEALGVSPLDDDLTYDGPVEWAPGRLLLSRTYTSPQGERVTKRVLVDNCTGWVREQYLYDEAGELLASAIASGHEHDPSYGAVVPRRVQLEWPQQDLRLDIRLKDVQVNEDLSGSPDLWKKPFRQDVPQRNLFDSVRSLVPGVVPQKARRRPLLEGIEPLGPDAAHERAEPPF